jgi:flagellar motor switch/type III secretory pathway protein FliN
MINDPTVSRQPLNADLIRSKGSTLNQHLALLAPLGETLVENAGSRLSKLAGTLIKLTVVSARCEKLAPLLQAEAGFDIVSSISTVSCWGKFDRDFDSLLCAACLGASGEVAGERDHERPATVIERKIRNHVAEQIMQSVAESLAELGDHHDLVVKTRARASVRKFTTSVQSYCLRLLLNVFDDACEFEISLGLTECVKLLGGETDSASSAVAEAGHVMGHAMFPVEVFLKSSDVDVRQILNLAPGEILKLNVNASAPVELRLNGRNLSSGLLRYDQKRGYIKLIDTGQSSRTATLDVMVAPHAA